MNAATLVVALLSVARAAAPAGIPGAWDQPELVSFYNTSTTRASAAEIAKCAEWPEGKMIPWPAVVADWVAGGGRAEDCAAALIIAAGETACTLAGCESVQSGIWQVTSPDEPAPSGCRDGDTNPACTVDFVRNHITTYLSSANASKTTSYQIGCIGEFNKGNGWPGDPTNPSATLPPSYPLDATLVVPSVVPADHSGGGLGGTQSNWVGPFCHAGGFTCEANDPYCTSKTQSGISGDNWGGGSEWVGTGQGSQIYPFPYYYYARMVESQGDGSGHTGGMFCDTVMAPVGQCGGVAAQGKPNCSQPVSGQAPAAADQACLDSITELAIQLAGGICKAALAAPAAGPVAPQSTRARGTTPSAKILDYLHSRGEALDITTPRPIIATYIDYRDINWLAPAQTLLDAVAGGSNVVIIAFLLATGPTDFLEGWAAVDPAIRNNTLATIHAAGAIVMLSAGGASEEPYARITGKAYGAAAGALCASLGLDGVDFDLENIAPGFNFAPLYGPALVSWMVDASEAARAAIGPARLISHAPQAPYFGPIGEDSWVGPSGGYTGVWNATKSIDFFNVQFYNQGDCYTSYASLFNSSAGGDASCPFPGTSVAELVAMGIDADAIIVGKPLLVDDADTGYVAGATLGEWFKEAASSWKAGAFCWSWEKTAGPIWAAEVF
jgi:chitinase